MRNSKIITAQRMLLVRLYQLAERRDRVTDVPRPIAVYLSELKYHLSVPALEGLGAARDKGVHYYGPPVHRRFKRLPGRFER